MPPVAGPRLSEVDPRQPSFFVRPDFHQVLARLRAEAPVHQFADGQWCVTRYLDIRDISRDPATFCSGRGVLVNDPMRAEHAAARAPSIVQMDPPTHGEHRRLLQPRFSPRALSAMTDTVRRAATDVLDRVPVDRTIDFVDRISAPFPIAVIAELLGIPEDEREDFRRWSDAAIESPDAPEAQRLTDLVDLTNYLGTHIRRVRRRPGSDLVSLLATTPVGGRLLEPDELLVAVITLLVAGNETTRTLITGSVEVLAQHPEQRRLLAGEPALLRGALEECLRWTTPIQTFCRTATADVELRGRCVRRGDYLVMLYASGNRDEEVFGDAGSRFDISRIPNPSHLAFGFGEHVCLGAALARLEARCFFEAFLARFQEYRVVGPARRVASTVVAGIAELPVVLAP